jgi:hypothetical protein
MKIYSERCKNNFELYKWDLCILYNLYKRWCDKNQYVEIEKEEFINDPSTYFDYIIIRACIEDKSKVTEILESKKI